MSGRYLCPRWHHTDPRDHRVGRGQSACGSMRRQADLVPNRFDRAMSSSENLLIEGVREGKPDAWNALIAEYEGRLLAFVESRLRRRAASEDVVQETFVGFLTSLPNFDKTRPLESYLFSIAAHKLTDYLRREGRRPTIPLSTANQHEADWDLPGSARKASSMMRSRERRGLEEQALADGIALQIANWRKKGDFSKIQCMELLFNQGVANKEVANLLGLTEQQVANFKYDFLERLRKHVRRANLSPDVFPELHEEDS